MSSELGQNCEIVILVLIYVGGYSPRYAIQSRNLEAPDGMGNGRVVIFASHETKAAFLEESDVLSEDFVTFGEIRVSLVCEMGKALDSVDGQFTPGYLRLSSCSILCFCFHCFTCHLHVVFDRGRSGGHCSRTPNPAVTIVATLATFATSTYRLAQPSTTLLQ